MRCWPFLLLFVVLAIRGGALEPDSATKALHQLFDAEWEYDMHEAPEFASSLRDYQESVEGYKFHWFLMNFNQRGGIQTTDELADSLRFETLKDYEDWLARLRAFPALMDQTIALEREAIRERMVHPK